MPNRVQTKHPVTEVLEEHLQLYLIDLGDTPPSTVYDMVLNSIERPMLQLIMQHAKDNQSLAAEYLGLNRNTLRKKLLAHGLLSK